MKFLATFAALLSCLVTILAQAPCAKVHFVVARGSGEPQGEGFLRSLVSAVNGTFPGAVTSEAVVYPAQLNFSNIISYVTSESTGVTAAKNQLTAFVKKCPQTKLVVTGVSQVGTNEDVDFKHRLTTTTL
jgi:acetylxylan esterase